MLSVFATFQKVLLLTSRFFGYVLTLTLTTRLLESCLSISGRRPRHDPFLFLELSVLLAGLIFGAASDAALLGLLRCPADAGLRVIWSSVQAYTWVLLRLGILIALVAIVALAPLGLLVRWLHWTSLAGFAFAFVYLVLIKFALAYPLVVDEQLNARQAMKRSWEMTRGHFWYVVGCFVLMAFAHMMVGQLFATPWLDASVPLSFSYFAKHVLDGFFDSLWIILGWQMYLEIKNADASPVSETEMGQAGG